MRYVINIEREKWRTLLTSQENKNYCLLFFFPLEPFQRNQGWSREIYQENWVQPQGCAICPHLRVAWRQHDWGLKQYGLVQGMGRWKEGGKCLWKDPLGGSGCYSATKETHRLGPSSSSSGCLQDWRYKIKQNAHWSNKMLSMLIFAMSCEVLF